MVAAEGGHFDAGGIVVHQDHSEVRANQAGMGEKLDDPFRQRAGGDVEILRLNAQKQIAHRTAHQPRLVAGGAERPDNVASEGFGFHCGGRGNLSPRSGALYL